MFSKWVKLLYDLNFFEIYTHLPPTAHMTCVHDRRQTSLAWFQWRAALSYVPVTWHSTAVGRSSSTDEDDMSISTTTSPTEGVTSATATSRRTCRLMIRTTTTSRMRNRPLTLARYTALRRCTAVDHVGRLQCLWDLSFLQRRYHHLVDSVCRRCIAWWWTSNQQHRWRHQAVLLHALPLQRYIQ